MGEGFTLTAHQCNFFPYWPIFQKIEEADIFVVMKHCQFEKNGYQNRFNFDDKWKTMSIRRGIEPIYQKIYTDPDVDWLRIKNSLPSEYQDLLSKFDDCISDSLADTNIEIIRRLLTMLNSDVIMEFDYETDLKSTDRLIDLCKRYGANRYISGIGGVAYIDLEKFEDAGIEVVFQNVQPEDNKPILKVLMNETHYST